MLGKGNRAISLAAGQGDIAFYKFGVELKVRSGKPAVHPLETRCARKGRRGDEAGDDIGVVNRCLDPLLSRAEFKYGVGRLTAETFQSRFTHITLNENLHRPRILPWIFRADVSNI